MKRNGLGQRLKAVMAQNGLLNAEEAESVLQDDTSSNEAINAYWEKVYQPAPEKPAVSKDDLDMILTSFEKEYEDLGFEFSTVKPIFERLISSHYGINITDDPEYDTSKGLFVIGAVGVGKTHAFQFARKNFLPALWLDCRTIGREIKADGIQCLDKYGKAKDLMIDDLGTEPIVKDFGNKYFPVQELLSSDRVNVFLQQGKKTYITTNATEEQLSNYDYRVLDRLNQLCNTYFCENETSYR